MLMHTTDAKLQHHAICDCDAIVAAPPRGHSMSIRHGSCIAVMLRGVTRDSYLVDVAVYPVVQDQGHQQLLHVRLWDVELLRHEGYPDPRVRLYKFQDHLHSECDPAQLEESETTRHSLATQSLSLIGSEKTNNRKRSLPASECSSASLRCNC